MQRRITDIKILGSFIHDARVKANLTQQELADKAGVSRRWLIDIEQGAKSGAEIGKIFALLNALEIETVMNSQGQNSIVEANLAPQISDDSSQSFGLSKANLSQFPSATNVTEFSQVFAESPLQQRLRKTREEDR